jgi:DNA polymerase III subunit beta
MSMEISVNRNQLWTGIDTVLDAVASKPALPILANILLNADNEHLVITATDLDLAIRTKIPANVKKKGSFTVQARMLAGITREWPDTELSIKVEDERLLLSGKLGSEEGNEGAYVLAGISPEEYPEVPTVLEGLSIDCDSLEGDALPLGNMINKTAFAVSKDETRPVLNGVLWQIDAEGMSMVATDGHRLAQTRHIMSLKEALDGEEDREIILPPQACTQVTKLFASGKELKKVTLGESQVLFEFGDTYLVSRIIEGPYVDYKQVIPQSNDKELHLAKDVLIPAVRRVSLLASSYTHQIRMRIAHDNVEMTAASQEVGGEAKERIPAVYGHEELEVGYNANYLLEILRKIDDQDILLELNDAVTAVLIRPGNQEENVEYFCLLMPLRPSG